MYIEVPITTMKRIEITPCLKCGGVDIIFNDFGRNPSNQAYGQCINCNREIVFPCLFNVSKESIVKMWNRGNDPEVVMKEYQAKIKALENERDKLFNKEING